MLPFLLKLQSAVRARLNETLETILSKDQEAPKFKKVQHSNAKNAVLFEAINLIIHSDSEPNLLVRACNQLGQFLSNRETNLRYLALESMCHLATSEFSHEEVKKHQEVVILSMKVCFYIVEVGSVNSTCFTDGKRCFCETTGSRPSLCHV